MINPKAVFKFAGGELVVWLQEESGSICLKSLNKYDDPVKLGEEEAVELAELLVRLSRVKLSAENSIDDVYIPSSSTLRAEAASRSFMSKLARARLWRCASSR